VLNPAGLRYENTLISTSVHKDVQHPSADIIFRSMLPPYEQSLFPQGRLYTFHEYYGTGRIDHRRTK